MNYFMLMFKLCLNFNHRHFHGNTLERCAFSFLDTILSGFLLLYLFIYLLPQTYIHIKQIKDYIEEKGNAVLPLPACISPLMSTNQSTSDSCCMWTWPRLHTAVLSVPPCTKKKKSLSLFYLSAISCYRLSYVQKENKSFEWSLSLAAFPCLRKLSPRTLLHILEEINDAVGDNNAHC